MEEKLTYQELALKIKSKYPQYKDMDDTVLVDKMVSKYPVYGELLKKKDSGDEVSKSSEEPITSVGSETTAQKFGSQQLFDKDGKIPQNSKLADKPKTEQESNFVPDTYFDEKISEGDSRYGVSIYNYSKSNIEKNDAVSKHNSIIENINSGSDSTYNAIIEDKKKQIQTEVEKLQKQFDFKEPTNDQEVDEYNKKVVDFNKQAKQIQEKILSTIDKDVEDYVNKTVPSVIEDKYIDKNDKAQLDTMIEKEMPVSYDDKKKYIDKIVESMTYFYDEKEKKEAKSELYNYLSEKLLFDKEGNPTQYALKNQAETRLEKVNKRISELENELSKPQFQRTRREITRGQFAGTRSYTPSSEETKLRDELSNLRQAQNKYREVIALPDKQEGVKVGKFSDAFTAETVADIATGGFASAFVALDVLGKIKKGEDATDAEKEMLNALSLNNAAKGDIKENMRTWAIVGQGVAGSLPFVTSIMLSGGTSALFRAGTKKALGWELKNTIKNRIINQVGNVTSAAARVPFYGGYYESLADRRAKIEMKYDPISGQFAADVKESEKPFIADATKQFVTTWTEFYAEELGGSIAARVVNPLAKRIGLKNITNSVFKKVTEATKINDPITEYLEEVVTGGMQIAIGEQDPKEFLTWKTQWETLLTTTVMSGTPQVLTAPFSKNTEGLAKHFNKKQIAEIEKILAIEDISEKAKQLTQFSYDNKIGEDAIRQLGDYAWKSQAEQADKITKEEAEKIKKDQTELATQQEQLDYLKEKGVEVPDGTSMENLNKLYNETKKSETPKVSERDTKLEFVKSRGIEIAEDISDNELDKTYREQRVSKIKEDNVEFDNQISESQKRLGLPTTPDIKISDDTELTLEQLDNGEPVTNEFLKKASDELYKKYNELEAMKQSDSRVYTTEQIESMQEFLGEEITKLEDYAKEQAETGKFVGETETGEVTERGAEEVVEVKPKIKEDGKEMQVSESEREDVPESETQAAEGGETEAAAVAEAAEAEIKLVEPLSPEEGAVAPLEEEVAEKGVEETIERQQIEPAAEIKAAEPKVVKATGIKPKNLRDVYRAGREVFGLDKSQALAQAVVVDRIVGNIARRQGVGKDAVYSGVEFRKGLSEEGARAPQGAKGAISIMRDGRAVISALTNPNVSTPLHEIAHLYEKYTTKPERDAVLKWAKTKTWTTETSEKFARGFERYLADGKAPVPSLQKVFDRFKAWLTDIYNGITGSEIDIELNDAMRGVYSAMLGEGVVKTKKRTAAETKPSTTGFDDVDALLFQDVLFQGEDKTEKHTKAVNLLVDKAESAKEDVEKFVREKLANAGNPVREEIITNVLKERGYAKEKQSGKMRSEGKQKQPKGKGDSDLSEVDRAELQDRKKDKKVSQFGKRFFTATSQVSEEVQDLIVEKGIHLYEPTSLEEAVTVAKEMASNLSYEELKDIITSNRKMNEAVRANIAIQTLKKSTAEMRQNSKNGVSSPYLVNLQLEVLRSLKDNVSAAGLLMRATQGDEFTEYIAPDAWVQDYIDTVLGSRRTSMKEKWFNRASDLFDKKAKRAVSESVSETMDAPKVKKEIEKAKKRKPKAPKSEAAKKRNDIVAKWKKSLENRKTLFQAARSEFVWMEEDIQFARDVVQTYIEDGVYNRNVLAEKLSMQFESLGLPVEEEVLRRIIPDEFNGVPLDKLFERQQLDKAAESLATRIFGSVIETKKKDDPLLQMVNTLLSKFKERTETKEVKKKTDLEKVVDAISRVSDYKEVWKEARDLAIDKVDANESLESIQKELAKEKINYAYDNATKFTFTENQIRGVVRDAIRKKEINLDDLVRSHMSVRGATRETLRNFIIDSSGLDAEGAKTLSDAVYGVYERMLTQRATNIVSKEAKKMGDKVSGKEVEKRIVATETERLLDMILLKAFENDEFRNAYASVKGIPRITEDHVANIEMLADKVRETPSTGVKRMRKDDLLMYMRRLEGVSIQEALDTLWFAAVLSGVPTQVRNAYGAFGNVYGDLFLKIASNPLKAADIIKSQSRGFRFGRTKAGVIWRTGKYFFENRTDAPMASEYAVDKDSSWTNPFKFAAYLMRFMSANDQLALSVGKEAYATLLANEQKNVNYFKKAFSKEYRRRINEEVERVLGLSKEQLDEFDRIVKEESEEYGYDINEQKIRKQELIDEARPLELVKDAETIAAELTGNTKAYGTIGYLIEQIAKPLRSFTVNIKVRGKDYAIHPTKLLAVFTKISTNVATTQLSFTPFGFMNVLAGKHGFLPKDNPFIREMSPAKKRIHIARATAGTVLIGLIWGLMNPDDEDHWFQLTANGTGNYKDEKELRRIGWRPYSVFIGGYDGIRVSYRYTPFALLMAPLGYMSDRKRFTKKGKEKSEFELVAWAMTDVFTYIADNTPLSGMLNFMNDIIGGIRGASDMAESGKDGAKAVAKAFLNIPKGIYGAGIVRSVIDTWDSFTRDERMENNKIYNDYIDRTVFEILPWEEDNFPARDSWGLPMKQYRTLDEFFGLRDEDQFASLREFHYEQGAGVVGMPNRNQLLFRVKFADGTQQYISLSRNNKNHRYLWNEVFLKKRGEYMRESMTSLKNTGYKNERYVEEFSKRKTKDQNNAKEDVYRYTLNKPLPVSEKNKE